MKVAIISEIGCRGGKTGECVQAYKTADALLGIGVESEHLFVDRDGVLYRRNGLSVGEWDKYLADFDVVHAIPPIQSNRLNRLPKIKALLVGSTIFWQSLLSTWVVHRNTTRLSLNVLSLLFKDILAYAFIKSWTRYEAYDMLLANSEDELRCVRRYCRLKRTCQLSSVPNAIDQLPLTIDGLARPEFLPKDDYIIVPGVFAYRKNQKLLIEALQDSPYTVVFMGGAHSSGYMERCKKAANGKMIFLGHIEHRSDEFYTIMKHARVACLPSNCETPGIALLEAAALGARPVVSFEGGTAQYYGWDACYFNPLSRKSLLNAIDCAWRNGRLSNEQRARYAKMTWETTARMTADAYRRILR